MGLFGDISKLRAKPVVSKTQHESKKKKQPTLVQLAEEKFGKDRKLIMWIEAFLDQRREAHLLPTRLSWIQQLDFLEGWPEEEREEQVRKSIACGYRSLAYQYKGNKKPSKVKSEYQAEEEILYGRGF